MKEGELTINQDQFAVYHTYEGNLVHPTAVIESGVRMGKGNIIGAYCVIAGNTELGDNNWLMSHISIGTAPEHRNYWREPYKGVSIGNNNIIREFVTVNAGTVRNTVIANDCALLRNSHVGHDCFIACMATLSCNVLVGGESFIGSGANMGLGSMCHQRSRIGAFAMVGMGTVVTKQTPIHPFNKYAGVPARHLGRNGHVTDGMTEKEIAFLTEMDELAYREFLQL